MNQRLAMIFQSDKEFTKEEVDEARDEQIHIKNGVYGLWNDVKENKDAKSNVEFIRNHAEKLALEACQIAAVCEKILKGI